jgi:HD domain-containing protein
MILAGIKVIDTPLVRDAIDLARSSSEPYIFNHVMRSWLFAVSVAEATKPSLNPELLAVAAILHDLGLTDRYFGTERFEVDGANAARTFLTEHGIPMQQTQLVWDAIALHTTHSIAVHKEPEVATTHSGIFMDVMGAGLDLIPKQRLQAILSEFPRLAMKKQFLECLCSVVRRKPGSTYDNSLRDIGIRYVEGFATPSSVDFIENAPFAE